VKSKARERLEAAIIHQVGHALNLKDEIDDLEAEARDREALRLERLKVVIPMNDSRFELGFAAGVEAFKDDIRAAVKARRKR
jgi:hypothetical protein